jgi:hypothetical protein
MPENNDIGILKSLWTRNPNGYWGVHAIKGIALKRQAGQPEDLFTIESQMELLTSTPPKNIDDFFNSFGHTDWLLKQSILPVVAWVDGAPTIRCIGTAFVISCTGYVLTASHVVLDPQESGYGQGVGLDGNTDMVDGVVLGVLMPLPPAAGVDGFRLIPFERATYWGEWLESPLIHEARKLKSLTDVAVCKLPELGGGSAYQPLHLSVHPFGLGEKAYAVGYAEMKDIPIQYDEGRPVISKFDWELYVSTGQVTEVFPMNHIEKQVPTPGPCFGFDARIPGKMSGAPIFGAEGAVVRGVVSRSFSGEKHAYGCMIGPVMSLPFPDGLSLEILMREGKDGMAVIKGRGL